MRWYLQALLIASVGAVLGLVLNAASGRPTVLNRPVYPAASSGVSACSSLPQAHAHRFMPLAEAVTACAQCTVGFVDARGAAAFASGHIPGAVHLPPAGHPDEGRTLERLRRFQTLVVYDEGGSCGLAQGVADRLDALGFKDVRLLKGWRDWEAARGPAQSGACEACEEERSWVSR
jgi:3-mercaptopyruvate sulfurtransferase SseA